MLEYISEILGGIIISFTLIPPLLNYRHGLSTILMSSLMLHDFVRREYKIISIIYLNVSKLISDILPKFRHF